MARGCFYVFLTAMVVANQLFFSSSLAMHRRCMAREEGVGGLTIHRVYTLCCIMSPILGCSIECYGSSIECCLL